MSEEDSITPINKAVPANLEQLSEILGKPTDLNTEVHGPNGCAGLAYITGLTDWKDLKTNLLQPLIPILAGKPGSLSKVVELLPETGPRYCSNLEGAASDLLEGRAVLFINGIPEAVSFATQKWARHEPKEPPSERVIRGPREGFTETLDDNIAMIRRWILDRRLRADDLRIGRVRKPESPSSYLSGVVQPRLVKEVYSRLSAIDIDGIIESGYIEQLIKDRRASVFPLTQSTERTDKVTAAILEGRVAVLVDKSPFAIIVPVTVNELYQSPEDYYFDFWLGGFLRLIRLLGSNLSVALPGLYVALATVNPEMLPTQFAIAIAGSRAHIPIPLVVEVLLLELVGETFREAGLRLPGNVGATLGIVAGVVLGFAGVLSGFVSPATLIVVSFTAIASFSGPSYPAGIAWRLLKYLLIIGGAFLGLFGLTLAGLAILIHAADLKSFGVSYLAPWAPLQWRELADGPFRAPFWSRRLRPATYRPQDRLRSGGTKKEDETDE